MGITPAAKRWIRAAKVAGLTAPALLQIRVEAARIATRRGSTRTGKNHLEEALEMLTDDCPDPMAPDYDALAHEPVTSQYQDSCDAAGM